MYPVVVAGGNQAACGRRVSTDLELPGIVSGWTSEGGGAITGSTNESLSLGILTLVGYEFGCDHTDGGGLLLE